MLTGSGEPTPIHRDEWRARYADLTELDVAVALELAEDLEEVAAAAHLSLLLFGVAGCARPFTARGRTWASLHQLVDEARTRCGARDTERTRRERAEQDEITRLAARQGAEQRRLVREEREERIRQLGFVNATSQRPP